MNNFYNYFNLLKYIANNYDYYISSLRPLYTSKVNHTRKIIEIRHGNSIEVLYEFCHELGHCVIHNKIKHKFTNELFAWVVGLYFCFKVKLPVNINYFKYVAECLKTYK